MKVLVISATGNLGLRLVAALLTHDHSVVAYVRSSTKLQSLLPESIYQQITVIQGSTLDFDMIKKAIFDNNCDAVVNSAGHAAASPWGEGNIVQIQSAVIEAVKEAGLERGNPLRAWFLAGMRAMYYPGTEKPLSHFLPINLEHHQNYLLLKSLSPSTIGWSMLCPGSMVSESSRIAVPTRSSYGKLTADAYAPPAWHYSWLKYIPLINRSLAIAMNSSRYKTTFEQNADFIAEDLEQYDSRWIGVKVGVINPTE